jgi:hypothetical protein
MQQNKTVKNIFYLAIFTTVVVVTWIASSVYYRIVTPTTPQDTNQYTTPITPTFDIDTLSQLGARVQVPVDLSEQGNYLSDPLKPNSGSSSAELTEEEDRIEPTISVTPEPTVTPENQPLPTDQPLDESQDITPPPEESL